MEETRNRIEKLIYNLERLIKSLNNFMSNYEEHYYLSEYEILENNYKIILNLYSKQILTKENIDLIYKCVSNIKIIVWVIKQTKND